MKHVVSVITLTPWTEQEQTEPSLYCQSVFFKMSAIAIVSVLALAPWAKQEARMYIYSIDWQSINPTPTHRK